MSDIACHNATDLTNALTSSVLGDRILLDAGVTYTGNFICPDKGAGTSYITIQLKDADMAAIPAGTRVSRTQISSLATISTNTQDPAIRFAINSHHWKIIGCNITATSVPATLGQSPRLVGDMNDTGATYGQWPKNITIDRCVIHPYLSDPLSPYREFSNGVWVDGENITVTECDIYDFGVYDSPNAAGLDTVTAATNASPCQITLATGFGNPGRKFLMTFQNTSGTSPWNALNRSFIATWVSTTTMTLQTYDINLTLTNFDTSGFGAYPGGYKMMASDGTVSHAIAMIVGPGPYIIHNNFLEAYYSAFFSGGAGGTWIDPAHQNTVDSVGSISQVTLHSSPTGLQVGDLIAFDAVQDQNIDISGMSASGAGGPTTLKVDTHRFPANTNLYPEGYIIVSGFTGSWAPCNGNWGTNAVPYALTVDSTHITIPVDSSTFGAVTATSPKWVAHVKTNSGSAQWHVGKVTNISGAVVDFDWWGHQPENLNGNGAGIKIATGANVQYRGRPIDGITITNNTISNRTFWLNLIWHNAKLNNHVGTNPKAHWEAKDGSNVLIEGNIFQQEGGSCTPNSDPVSLALNQANQNGATPWVALNNWTVRNNWFKCSDYHKISLIEEYETGLESSNFVFTNNLCGVSQNMFMQFEGTNNTTITHNTVRNLGTDYSTFNFFNIIHVNANATVKDNLGNWGASGYVVQGPDGTFTPLTRSNNIYIDIFNNDFTPPAGDLARVETDADMKFTDFASADAGGDYHGYKLLATSPGYHAASDGKDCGVDFTALDAALGGTPTPDVVVSRPVGVHHFRHIRLSRYR